MSVKRLIICALLIFSAIGTRAERPWYVATEAGIGLAFPVINEMLPEGVRYAPLPFLGQIYYDLIPRSPHHKLILNIEPQFTVVRLHRPKNTPSVQGKKTLYREEFGVAFALRYGYVFPRQISLYGQVGAGPHYINTYTRLQHKGFLFCDSFAVGIKKDFKRNNIFLEFRYRHISNASIRKPNGGIDNFFVMIGYTRDIVFPNKKSERPEN